MVSAVKKIRHERGRDDPKFAPIVALMAAKVKKAQKIIDKKFAPIRRQLRVACVDRDWKEAVVPFLGKLKDADIAKVIGVDKILVARLRRKLGIANFCDADLMGEIVEKMGGLYEKKQTTAQNNNCPA